MHKCYFCGTVISSADFECEQCTYQAYDERHIENEQRAREHRRIVDDEGNIYFEDGMSQFIF